MWCITVKITEYFPKSFFAEQVNRFSFLLLLLPLPRYHSRGCVMLLCVCMCTCVCMLVCVTCSGPRWAERKHLHDKKHISVQHLPACLLTDWLTDWLTPQAGRMWSPSHCHSKNPPKVYEEIKCVSAETFYGPFIFFFMLWNLTTSDNTVPFEQEFSLPAVLTWTWKNCGFEDQTASETNSLVWTIRASCVCQRVTEEAAVFLLTG